MRNVSTTGWRKYPRQSSSGSAAWTLTWELSSSRSTELSSAAGHSCTRDGGTAGRVRVEIISILLLRSSGVFFTQTKPPTGPFWANMNESMFNTLESHTVNPEEEEKRKRAAQEAANEEMAARVAASVATKDWQ